MPKTRGSKAASAQIFAKRALALEEELERFERFCAEVAAIPLDAQKNLERGARMLQELSEGEQRLNARAEELAASLGELRTRQGQSAAAVVEWATALKTRRDLFAVLQERFLGLSGDAATLDSAIRAQLAGSLENRTKPDPGVVAHVVFQLRELASRWKELEEEAEREGFRDLVRDAEARHQQLYALAGKLDRGVAH